MSDRITVEELSELMKKAAGVTVTPEELQRRMESGFDVIGIDSLGLLGIVGELENRYGIPLPADAEKCKTPGDFIDLINSALTTGA